MAERIQFHFNNRAKNLSDAINRNDASLFPPELSPNEKNHNEEDELSPWSNILTPKLGVSVPKQIQNVHSLTSTWTHLKRDTTNQKRRPFTKEQISIEEKPPIKSYKFYKAVLNKVSENMNPDTSNNELMRYKGSSSMSKIGLVDLSSPSPIERKDSKLQLIIGNMEEVGVLHDYSGYSGVKSKADLGNDVVSNRKTYQDFRKTFGGNLKEVETELNPTETMKNYFKMYSQTARSLKELRKKKGEEVFTIPAKGVVHKKVLGRETVSRSLNKRLESKYLYANVLTQMTKTDLLSNRQATAQQDPITVLGIISEGVRIVGSQRHSRTPSKVVPKKEEKSASEQRDDKYGLKDKLQILRRIRNRTQYQIQTSPSREEYRDSSKEDGNRDSSRLRPKITSPTSTKKLYPKQGALRTEITPPRRRLEIDGGDGEQHVSLPQVVNNTSSTSLLKDPLNKGISKTRNKNSGSFNDELRKLLAYREKTQAKAMEANNETLLKTFETSKEIPEKPVFSTSPKFRTAAGFLIRQGSPIRQAQGDFGLTQEKFTKSFSQIKQRDSSVVELKTDALGVGPIAPFFQNNGTPSKLLLSNSNKLGYRVGKRSNFEIQAALLQEQRVQKNIKTLKTEFKRE